MRSILWFLLIFSSSEASSEETSPSNESSSTLELQSPVFALADDIYDKQKECDAIVGEAVVKALDKGITNQFPVPNEIYLQCRKTLDEKKKEYIKTALIGLNYYSKMFPMVLSNKRLVTLPVPADNSLSAAADPEFDIQQEICMTNKLCLTLVRLKFSKYDVEDIHEQKESVSRCLSFLNELKIKYIDVKKKEGKVFERDLGLPVVCIDGEVTLTLPEDKKDIAYQSTSATTASETPKITPAPENVEDNKDSTTSKPEPYNPYRNHYDNVVKELKSIYEQKSENEDIADQSSVNEVPSSDSEDDERSAKEEAKKEKSMTNDDTDTQEGVLPDLKANEFTTENQVLSDHPANEISFNDSKPDNAIAMSKPSEDVYPPQEVEKINTRKPEDIQENGTSKPSEDVGPSEEKEKLSTMKSEYTTERNQNTKTEVSENIPIPSETEMSPNKDDEITNKRAEPTAKTSRRKRPQKPKDEDNVELVSYRVRVVSKNGNGKVVKIQASGNIKKTESGNPTSNQPSNIDPKSDGGTDFGLVNNAPPEINEEKRRHPDSLEDNIIFMENDCKELLQFGEQLTQHKMLSSLIHLENHYNECIKRLDTLKKMYIEKHQLEVLSHKNFFPLTLPSGVLKLVSLPTQFLKTDIVETQTSNLTSDDVFELRDFFRKNDQSEIPTLNHREPFDDPAFISNEEFLKSLQQGTGPSDTSTFSKVASMLHMNGGHTDKGIAE